MEYLRFVLGILAICTWNTCDLYLHTCDIYLAYLRFSPMEYLWYVCRWSFLPSILAIFRDILAIYIASMLKIFFSQVWKKSQVHTQNRKYRIASMVTHEFWNRKYDVAYLRFFSRVLATFIPCDVMSNSNTESLLSLISNPSSCLNPTPLTSTHLFESP